VNEQISHTSQFTARQHFHQPQNRAVNGTGLRTDQRVWIYVEL